MLRIHYYIVCISIRYNGISLYGITVISTGFIPRYCCNKTKLWIAMILLQVNWFDFIIIECWDEKYLFFNQFLLYFDHQFTKIAQNRSKICHLCSQTYHFCSKIDWNCQELGYLRCFLELCTFQYEIVMLLW